MGDYTTFAFGRLFRVYIAANSGGILLFLGGERGEIMGKIRTNANYNPKSLENLRQGISDSDKAREMQRRSAEVQREKSAKRRLMRELIDEFSAKSVKSETIDGLKELFGISGSIRADSAVILAQLAKAISGDTEAARFLRDTSGQKPAENVQIGPIDAHSADLSQYSDEQLEALEADCLAASDGDSDGGPL